MTDRMVFIFCILKRFTCCILTVLGVCRRNNFPQRCNKRTGGIGGFTSTAGAVLRRALFDDWFEGRGQVVLFAYFPAGWAMFSPLRLPYLLAGKK